MLEEYNFSSEDGNNLIVFHEGQGAGILVSNAKQLIREHLGTNAEITIYADNDVKEDGARKDVNKMVLIKDNEVISLKSSHLTYTYILKENNTNSADRTKHTISCITDARIVHCICQLNLHAKISHFLPFFLG